VTKIRTLILNLRPLVNKDKFEMMLELLLELLGSSGGLIGPLAVEISGPTSTALETGLFYLYIDSIF
jgi:hypothetical protein